MIAARRLPVVDVHRAASDPRGSAHAALSSLTPCDALAIHFDVDLVDFLDGPLAENTDRATAPSLTACGDMLDEPQRTSRAARVQTPREPADTGASRRGDASFVEV